jgi:putative transposase
MPRKTRIDAPGALHHIILKGIERKPIFKDDRDYRNFLGRLGKVLTETSTPCYAWALMPNHVHLLLRTGLYAIATVMRRVLTGYAQQFNRRHKRHGHLFQNRYKSFLCEENPYLLELVRYIHLNPFRGGLVRDLEDLAGWARCGHSVLMGRLKHEWAGYGLCAESLWEDGKFREEVLCCICCRRSKPGEKAGACWWGVAEVYWRLVGFECQPITRFTADE